MTSEDTQRQVEACAEMSRLVDTLVSTLHSRGYTRQEAIFLAGCILSRHVTTQQMFMLSDDMLSTQGSMH